MILFWLYHRLLFANEVKLIHSNRRRVAKKKKEKKKLNKVLKSLALKAVNSLGLLPVGRKDIWNNAAQLKHIKIQSKRLQLEYIRA